MEFAVRSGSVWARVRVVGSEVIVTYRPSFVRDRNRVKVVDHEGVVIDIHDLTESFPSSDEVVVWSGESEEPTSTAEWISAHIASGAIRLSEIGSLVDDSGGLLALEGSEYEIDGVRGFLRMWSSPVLVTDMGEEIELEQSDVSRLVVAGTTVVTIDGETW